MSSQERGLVGKMVGSMIRRAVRSRLRNLWWSPPSANISAPVIIYANHHGWLDGYLMFHAISRLSINCVLWVEEFDSFPLFRSVGAMRFAKGDLVSRIKTIRATIQRMRKEETSLVIFPEGVLHRPPGLLSFGRALETIATRVPNATLVPMAIVYEQSIHERPEAWIQFGEAHDFTGLGDCQNRLEIQLSELKDRIRSGEEFELLAQGTPSINERWDMRKIPAK